ncbi:MAG: pantoate--beta-alanine ligase [Wenzhouxiangellaceae bacterium]|nr:pantoate--beta-alanine ligase [Wenzhouxiangellaceae bacterium]
MRVIDQPGALKRWRAGCTRPVHLVPTMGNLHSGHLRLVEQAAADDAEVVVSIFVNPTQFAPGEDFERYPRTPDADLDTLSGTGCDVVWMPAPETMYPLPEASRFGLRPPPALAGCLCGAHRPGHFDGVCNVVMRLFWQIRPDRAFFGEKDYQQFVILKKMAEDFSLPTVLEPVATVREPDGLALSSRNRYLDAAERPIAAGLHQALCELAERARKAGPGTFPVLERSAKTRLETMGFRPEYVEIRDSETLGPPTGRRDRAFAAAWLGRARLIDNVALRRQ